MLIYSNKQQQNVALDSFELLNQLIYEWLDAIKNEKDAVCVAISRKAPRLLECGLGKNRSGIPVITELALPFLNLKKYRRCVIVDEAIYHGTTFEKILTILNDVNPQWDDLKAMPLLTTLEALNSNVIRKHIAFQNKIIEQNELPFFVDAIISKFLQLGKPYDVEYPIVYIDLNQNISETIMDDMMDMFATIEAERRHIDKKDIHYYKVENYCHECDETFYSYTYRVDYLFCDNEYGMITPDFSKLRFFAKGNRLCVVAMSPYSLPEQYIAREHRMFSDDFLDIWKYIYDAVNNIGNEEYQYQKTKSLVMATNYLLSFSLFLSLRDSLREVLSNYARNVEFYQIKEDLQYLFGWDLADGLIERLKKMHSFVMNGAALNLGVSCNAYIPESYSGSYNQQMALDNLRKGQTNNVSLMVSSMFSAMHWLIEIPSREDRHDNYSRLRFGESFSSIRDRFARNNESENLLDLIHYNIDQRIDRGSIVPNYVRMEEGAFCYWKRLFRSGENEDLFKDQLLRVTLSIIMDYFKITGCSYVQRDVLEFILSIIYFAESDNEKKILPEKVFGLSLRPTFNLRNLMYEMTVMVGGEKLPILQYAIDNGILQEDRFEYISMTGSSYVEKISKGCPLDNRMRVSLNKILSFVSHLDDKGSLFSDDMRALLNNFYYDDEFVSFVECREHHRKAMEDYFMADAFDSKLIDKMEAYCIELFLRKVDKIDEYKKLVKVNHHDNLYIYLSSKEHHVIDNESHITMLSALNLWSYYHIQKVDKVFNQELYDVFLSYMKNESFSDGVSCYDWLYMDGSYKNVLKISEEELRNRLCELIN